MKFGFIAHAAKTEEINMLRALDRLNGFRLDAISFDKNSVNEHTYFNHAIDTIDVQLESKRGATCSGKVVYLPILPEQFSMDQSRSLSMIMKTALELERWGADIIGLGGYTAVIGGRGKKVQSVLEIAKVTTGNAYTVHSSIETLDLVVQRLRLNFLHLNITVVGFPGSIALAISKILAKRNARLNLVGRSNNIRVQRFLSELDQDRKDKITFTLHVKTAVENADVVISATSTGSTIEQDWLRKGAIVIDIGEPKDVIRKQNNREDVLILDGGRFNFEDGVSIKGPLCSLFKTGFYGCVGETILLALENLKTNLSIGRELNIDNIEKVGNIAREHGFIVRDLHSWSEPIDTGNIDSFSKYMAPDTIKALNLITFDEILEGPELPFWNMYKNHVNPVLTAISEVSGFKKTFIEAEGLRLRDRDGKYYMDYVGGYGSVNIGHNHPRVLSGIQKYLRRPPPSLLQISPGIFTSALAENLTKIAPASLDMVFFCNSGAEAVESALKMARMYTQRTRYVSTRNSFHGKTYGALSVTGREKYRKHFLPLLSETIHIDFDDLEQLEEALKSRDVAAFIVEPIQGEGGVNVPKEGYLREARDICNRYGTLLIADEVQTGFGRTGKMFAVEHEDTIPDIMCIAKSLGGGIVPIGASITKKNIWKKCFGSQSNYLLHTSTFGGNNFCSCVGLLAIETLVEEKLSENAAEIGAYLKKRLNKLKKKYDFIIDVRGKGLMQGIEFDASIKGGLERLKEIVTSMIPQDMKNHLYLLPESIINRLNTFIEESCKDMEQNLRDNFATQISAQMLNDHGILTIVTLNNPNVMRIQPPLVITQEEADYFVDSLDKTCQSIRI